MNDLWGEIQETFDLLDKALLEAKERGARMVEAEAHYYSEKAEAVYELKNDSTPTTLIPLLIKGIGRVTKALRDYHASEVEYKNAVEAINVYKLRVRVLNDQLQREWTQAGRSDY